MALRNRSHIANSTISLQANLNEKSETEFLLNLINIHLAGVIWIFIRQSEKSRSNIFFPYPFYLKQKDVLLRVATKTRKIVVCRDALKQSNDWNCIHNTRRDKHIQKAPDKKWPLQQLLLQKTIGTGKNINKRNLLSDNWEINGVVVKQPFLICNVHFSVHWLRPSFFKVENIATIISRRHIETSICLQDQTQCVAEINPEGKTSKDRYRNQRPALGERINNLIEAFCPT